MPPPGATSSDNPILNGSRPDAALFDSEWILENIYEVVHVVVGYIETRLSEKTIAIFKILFEP